MVTANTARNVVGIVGNVISFGLFISPLPTFYKIWKNKATEDFSPLPYIATAQNCMLWVFYGLPFVKPNSILVVTINGVGLFLEIIYLAVYFIYTTRRQRLYVLKFMAAELVLMVIVVTVTLTCAHTHTKRTLIVGILACIFNACMYASPLSVMSMVIRTRSVKYMPFFLSLAGFLNGLCWMAYALIKLDLFIAVPNGLGALFGAVQLILYGCYYSSTVWDEDDQKPKSEVQLQAPASTVAPGGGSSEFHSIAMSSR
ncbi:bidirectional sugar transporter SWEET6b-like [Magnolia sinica]|uniref:bidirectional sugar transporter SWEET6b-like n=1 Tax=Magnolia sinica TaxID=86752 RepID=UPI00265B5371|nr:bidirectional sugar transporter SWEET6b-like [Magnolia sinica]